jgi:hypothetical protein
MTRDWVGDVVRTCVQDHPWDRPLAGLQERIAGKELGGVEERAVHHGVGNLVYLSLRSLETTDHEPIERLERRYLGGNLRHLQALAGLNNIAKVLGDRAIPWLVFKGPILAEIVYPRPDLRSYRDLDILVPRSAFADAVRLLEAEGAKLLDRNWDFIVEREAGQLHFELSLGTLVDVHWHVLNRREIRRSLSVPVESMFERARAVEIDGTPLLTFDPIDSLLHLCLHAALSGGVRLIWLKDIERLLASTPIDWDELSIRARRWRAASPVAAVLARARRTLAIDAIPTDMIRELAPARGGRAVDATVDAIWPVESLASSRGPAATWMRYRRDSFATGRETLRERVALRRSLAAAPPDDDASDVMIFVPSGDETTKARFLELVSGTGIDREPH